MTFRELFLDSLDAIVMLPLSRITASPHWCDTFVQTHSFLCPVPLLVLAVQLLPLSAWCEDEEWKNYFTQSSGNFEYFFCLCCVLGNKNVLRMYVPLYPSVTVRCS